VITDTVTDIVIDITISSTQTPASSVDSNILLRINPCLLTGEVKVKGRERKIKRYILAPTLLSVLR
jgi:hypothetical protein